MVNLCVLSLLTLTSVGLNVKGGIKIVASLIELFKFFGGSGNSADAPSTTLNSPVCVRKTVAILPRKNSKSCVDALFGFGVFITTEPVPVNVLAEKSNELPVIVSTAVTVSDAPVTFATVGLKSAQSRKSKTPVGSGSSGSTLAAVYVGMSSKFIWSATAEYESTEKNSPAP